MTVNNVNTRIFIATNTPLDTVRRNCQIFIRTSALLSTSAIFLNIPRRHVVHNSGYNAQQKHDLCQYANRSGNRCTFIYTSMHVHRAKWNRSQPYMGIKGPCRNTPHLYILIAARCGNVWRET